MNRSPSPRLGAALRRCAHPTGVTVIDGGQIAWSQTAGGSGRERLFQAGSISKAITALAALELAARAGVDLDGDVNDRLVSWHLPGDHHVSLRQLLGHTSGLGVPYFPGYEQGAELPTLVQVLDGEAPSATPAVRVDPRKHGTFSYSGGGYAVVQQLVTDVAGVPFAEAASSLVLDPIGMSHSSFEQPLPLELHSAAARNDWHVYPEAGAAGLWTTPEDLARFTCLLQAVAAGRPVAVSEEAATELLTQANQLPAKGEWNLLPLLGIRPPDAAGLGIFLHGKDRFSHLGGAASFFSALAGSLVDGTGAVVMTATNPSLSFFKLLRTMSDDLGWVGFRQPARKRLNGLPGIRSLV